MEASLSQQRRSSTTQQRSCFAATTTTRPAMLTAVLAVMTVQMDLIHGFQSMPPQQQQQQQQKQLHRRASRPSLSWQNSDTRQNGASVHSNNQIERAVIMGSRTSRKSSKRNIHLDMVSKFVEEDLSLGMYMEAGLYQLVSSIRTQTQPLQRNQQRTRVRMATDPLQISMIQKDNPVQTLLRGMEGSIRLLRGETTFKTGIAPTDYRPNSNNAPLSQHQNRLLTTTYQTLSLELIGDLSVKNPAFVNILPTNSAGSTAAAGSLSTLRRSSTSNSASSDRVWITSFSLTESNGQIQSLDSATGKTRSVGSQTSKSMLWPNESNAVPTMLHGQTTSRNPPTYHDALLVSDGFLVPGKNSGGLYVVKNPTHTVDEETVCLTGGSSSKDSWFYHKSVWVDLTGDGRKSILTARAQMNSPFGNNNNEKKKTARTQLVWLEMPHAHAVDSNGHAVDADGSAFDPFHPRHLPWKSHVLDEGPDVMFAVADLDTTDETIEVISSEFFDRKVSVRSIQKGPSPRVVFRRVIDDRCGAPFSAILADLDTAVDMSKGTTTSCSSERERIRHCETRVVVDSGSTVATTKCGDSFSHILVTSQPCKGKQHASGEEGGALFAYRVPTNGDWRTEPWKRTTVASGFQVRTNLWNMINPGAPGFVYTFHPQEPNPTRQQQQQQQQRPMIAIAGDCSESAYILQPVEHDGSSDNSNSHDDDNAAIKKNNNKIDVDASTRYKLVCEIETGATVGSIGIGYGSFGKSPAGIAKLYLPLFEKNKMLVFALSGTVEKVRTMSIASSPRFGASSTKVR